MLPGCKVGLFAQGQEEEKKLSLSHVTRKLQIQMKDQDAHTPEGEKNYGPEKFRFGEGGKLCSEAPKDSNLALINMAQP